VNHSRVAGGVRWWASPLGLAIVALYLVLLGFDVWLLLVLRDVSWPERCALLLQIVGLYTLAFGLVGKRTLEGASPSSPTT
jgi:hypothetical protein